MAKVQVTKQNMESTYLYLVHKGEDTIAENRYKYTKKGVEPLSSFDIDRYVVLNVEDKEGMLNDICDMTDDHGSANIRELRRFAEEHGSDYNLPSMGITNSVLRSHTGLIRLYFDAVYQERKYG